MKKELRSNYQDDILISNYNFLVVGTVRNSEKKVTKDVLRLQHVLEKSKELHWLIIESDSEDLTIIELEKLKKKINNFRFMSLGNLRDKIPDRNERLAYCRNQYVREIQKFNAYKNIDYVIVCDLDGINTLISKTALASCWDRNDWDMCSANQSGPYYDVWPLRHKHWSPNDCWAQYNFFDSLKINNEKNLSNSVYSRMIKLPFSSEWIEVDSAFGGLAIYKKKLFDVSEYCGVDEIGNKISEHVPFNLTLKRKGAKLFINPRLINAEYTEHTSHLFLSKFIIRKFRSLLKLILLTFISKEKILTLLKNIKHRTK
jgi:hypothetical protein